MRRYEGIPRPGLDQRLAELGVPVDPDHTYYDESSWYEFSLASVEKIYEATETCEKLINYAVDFVIDQDLFEPLGIPENLAALARESRKAQQPSVYGRYDFAFDGTGNPKLLEFNADTPTALFEAAVLQWEWLKENHPEADQYNSVHEALIARWGILRNGRFQPRLTLTGMLEEADDAVTLAYMEDVARQAGWVTHLVDIAGIGFDGVNFDDPSGATIETMFKLYPWDWLAREPFFGPLSRSNVEVLEPPWRVIASSKGLLAVLWEMFPNHANLLPASFQRSDISGPAIAKPVLGREGADIIIDGLSEAPAPVAVGYGDQTKVWQALAPLPNFDNWHPVIGAWAIGGQPAGMGVREDRQLITGAKAKLRPHLIRD